VNAEAESA
jgi:hypothetical protein